MKTGLIVIFLSILSIIFTALKLLTQNIIFFYLVLIFAIPALIICIVMIIVTYKKLGDMKNC